MSWIKRINESFDARFDNFKAEEEMQPVEDIQATLSELLEAMSPEDERDSAIIRAIMQKTAARANAALTPEEQTVMKKYGLSRHANKLFADDLGVGWYSTPPLNRVLNGRRGKDYGKINFADMARKRPERAKQKVDAFQGDKITQYQDDLRTMKSNKWERDYHQRFVDNEDKNYIAALQKAKAVYDQAVADAEGARRTVTDYHKPGAERAQKRMDAIVGKYKKEPVEESFGDSLPYSEQDIDHAASYLWTWATNPKIASIIGYEVSKSVTDPEEFKKVAKEHLDKFYEELSQTTLEMLANGYTEAIAIIEKAAEYI